MAILVIGEKRYPVRQLEDLSMKLVAQFQHDLAAGEFESITDVRSMGDLRELLGVWGNLPKKEQANHPEGMFLMCFVVWATRATAGEDVKLLDAVDVPSRSIAWLPDPSDRQAPNPKARTGQSGHARSGKRKRKH